MFNAKWAICSAK